MTPGKREALTARMTSLGIIEDELIEKFITGSGSGGQKINKTSSCVYLKHESTGIEIKCQAQRSREMNRFLARRELCDRIDEIKNGVLSKRQQEIEKIRRQKRQKSRKQKLKMLADKNMQSIKKSLRKSPESD
jgi:peptide chain release factor